MTRSWPAGAVTGIGSLPGSDAAEACALVFGELPALPHLPELPVRGPGSQLIGRTAAALLVDLPVEIVPSGWRLASHQGRDARRALDDFARDLDALEAAADGYAGALKVQAAGPWTLAAGVELASGHRALADRGAVRDLGASLAEGLRRHVADVGRRVPGAQVVLQLDEPWLPNVLGGRVPTASGYGTLRSVGAEEIGTTLRDVLGVAPAGAAVVHCCAADVPIGLLYAAGADAVALDAALLTRTRYEALGEAVDAGKSLWLGVVGAEADDPSLDSARENILRIWGELGFSTAELADRVVPTPACGLASATPAQVRRTLSVLRDCGAWLAEAGD